MGVLVVMIGSARGYSAIVQCSMFNVHAVTVSANKREKTGRKRRPREGERSEGELKAEKIEMFMFKPT